MSLNSSAESLVTSENIGLGRFLKHLTLGVGRNCILPDKSMEFIIPYENPNWHALFDNFKQENLPMGLVKPSFLSGMEVEVRRSPCMPKRVPELSKHFESYKILFPRNIRNEIILPQEFVDEVLGEREYFDDGLPNYLDHAVKKAENYLRIFK